jgi:hypothetical protein
VIVSSRVLRCATTATRSRRAKDQRLHGLAPDKYVKPTWQPRLAHRLDLELEQRSSSLARLIAKFDELRLHV